MTPRPGVPRLPALVGPTLVLLLLAVAVTLAVWLQPRSLYTLALCTAVVTLVLIGAAHVARRRTPRNVRPDPATLRARLAAALEVDSADAIRDALASLGRWPFLLDAIPDADRERLRDAIDRHGLVAELIEMAGEQEGSRRVGAVLLLGWLAPPEAESVLTALVESRYLTIAEAAASGLLRLGTPAATATVMRMIGRGPLPDSRIVALLERASPAQLVPLLADAAEDDNARCRFWVAHLAGRAPDGRSLDVLDRLSRDDSLDVRANAAEGLGLLADERARPRLEQLLADDSWVVRAHAASALEALGATPSVTPLAGLLGSDEWWVRERAVRALEAAGAAAVPALRHARTNANPETRRAADDVLRLIADGARGADAG